MKSQTILDVFEGDPVRLVATAWGIEARSIYHCNLGRISKSDASDEKITQGERYIDPIGELKGLMPHEQHGQASMIRGMIKKILCDSCRWEQHACCCAPSTQYQVLDARLTIPVDSETTRRKHAAIDTLLTINMMAYGRSADHPTGLEHNWMRILLHMWANDMVHIAREYGYDPRIHAKVRIDQYLLQKMREFDHHSDRQERRHRHNILRLMNDMFADVLEIIECRL